RRDDREVDGPLGMPQQGSEEDCKAHPLPLVVADEDAKPLAHRAASALKGSPLAISARFHCAHAMLSKAERRAASSMSGRSISSMPRRAAGEAIQCGAS